MKAKTTTNNTHSAKSLIWQTEQCLFQFKNTFKVNYRSHHFKCFRFVPIQTKQQK